MQVISAAGSMQDPSGVVFQGGALLVADKNALSPLGAILRINPVSGGQTLVSWPTCSRTRKTRASSGR